MEIQAKAGIVELCVTFCKGDDIAVNDFIRQLDVKVIRKILTENLKRFEHGKYSIEIEEDTFIVKCKEHEFVVHRELLLKLDMHLKEVQHRIDQRCNSKRFTYDYPFVRKDEPIDGIRLDPNNDERKQTGVNINQTGVSNRCSLDEFNKQSSTPPSVGMKYKLSKLSGNFENNFVNARSGVDAKDSGSVCMNREQAKTETVHCISSGQNIVPSSSVQNSVPIAASPVSNPSSLDQSRKQTLPSVNKTYTLSSFSGNFEDEFFSAPSKPHADYKGFLNQRLVNIAIPTYSSVKKHNGYILPSNSSTYFDKNIFSASVEVKLPDRVLTYSSPIPLETKMDAEQAAAEKAYNALKEADVGINVDEDVNMLLYWHNSQKFMKPTYNPVPCQGPNITNFKCFVTYNEGVIIEGPVQLSKKLAKKTAAKKAWETIKDTI